MLAALNGLGGTYATMMTRLAGLMADADQFIHRAIKERGLWRQQQAELGKQSAAVNGLIRQLQERLDDEGESWKG